MCTRRTECHSFCCCFENGWAKEFNGILSSFLSILFMTCVFQNSIMRTWHHECMSKKAMKNVFFRIFYLQKYVVMYFAQPEQYMSTPGILYDFKVIISNDNDFENPSLRLKTYKLTEIYIYTNVSSSSLFSFSLIMDLPKFRVIPAERHVYQTHYARNHVMFFTQCDTCGIIHLLVVTILIVSWQFNMKHHWRLNTIIYLETTL